MPRVVLFAKGNLDVKDSLHSLTVGRQVRWNGINEIVRERYPGTTIRVRHETWTRSDSLLNARGDIPCELAEKALPLGAYPTASQFSPALFEAEADAFILSIQPDVTTSLLQHRQQGHLFYPSNHEDWPAEDQCWLEEHYVQLASLSVEQSMCNFDRIFERIRHRTEAPILVYNLSAVIPGEWVHCYEGLGETYATRIRRFNLALTQLSQRTGVSIVDVDRIVACAGADRVKLDTVHLNAEGCRLVAMEVVRILEDLGVLTVAEMTS